MHILFEPRHRKTSLLPYATNKAAEQCGLISAFVVRYLDRIIAVLAKSKLSRLLLVSVGEQANLSITWSKSSERGNNKNHGAQ